MYMKKLYIEANVQTCLMVSKDYNWRTTGLIITITVPLQRSPRWGSNRKNPNVNTKPRDQKIIGQTRGKWCSESNKTKCVHSWPVEQLIFLRGESLLPSRFIVHCHMFFSSCHRHKEAQPRAVRSTRDAEQSRQRWFTQLRTVVFLISERIFKIKASMFR